MRLALGVCAVFLLGVVVGGCEPDEPPIACGKGREAREYCCTAPAGEGQDSCHTMCLSTCASDEDCDMLETCQEGVCTDLPDDCSL